MLVVSAVLALTVAGAPSFTWVERTTDADGVRLFACPEANATASFTPARASAMRAARRPRRVGGLPLRRPRRPEGAARPRPLDAAGRLALATVAGSLAAALLAPGTASGGAALRGGREVEAMDPRAGAPHVRGDCGARLERHAALCPSAHGALRILRAAAPSWSATAPELGLARQVAGSAATLDIDLRAAGLRQELAQCGATVVMAPRACALGPEDEPAVRELMNAFIGGGFDMLSRVVARATTDAPSPFRSEAF
ncbi:MAG: hypothetical protein U1F43_22010 [Myxococcota bacterium]